MDDKRKRKLINNSVFSLVIIVGFFIISLICITDYCLIKSNCSRVNPQDTTSLSQNQFDNDSLTKPVALFSNDSNRTTSKTDTVITTEEKTTTSSNSTNNLISYDSIVFNLTLAVNAINNVLSSGAIALGILTLFIGLVGLFGFNTLKDDIREYKEKHDKDSKILIDNMQANLMNTHYEFAKNQNKKLESYNDAINEYKNDVNSYIHQIDDLVRESHTKQTKYINQTINHLYKIAYPIIEQMEDKEFANNILESIFHDLQIARLYHTVLNSDDDSDNDINIIAAFEYFKENGRLGDIPHLEYVAKNDSNERIRNLALEIIGRIRERNK